MNKLNYLLILVVVGVMGCVTETVSQQGSSVKQTMKSNNKIPGAAGLLTVTTTANNSNLIDMSIKNLARPYKVNPKARTYVVWEAMSGGSLKPQSIGILVLDKNSNAHLVTATPFRQFDIFITAELKANPGLPTGEKLLWASISH